MLTYELLPQERIFILIPRGPLTEADFQNLALEVDHQLAQHDTIRGVLVHTEEFPGWRNLDGLLGHLRFVRDRHDAVERVALASDSVVATLLPKLAGVFTDAEVKAFDYDEREGALAWLRDEDETDD